MKTDITGIILAGGLGRRMGGVDKGLQPLQGRPLVAHVIERLRPQVDTLLINANQNAATYARFGLPVINDALPGYMGPLAGLHAGLNAARTPLVLTVPCDSPFLPMDLVERLHHGLRAAKATVAIARTGEQVHPVFCLCQQRVLPNLSAYLQAGDRKFERWLSGLPTVEVSFDGQESAFENLNTRSDLARHEA